MVNLNFASGQRLAIHCLLTVWITWNAAFSQDIALLEREQQAFQAAAAAANPFVVQIETFGGMERVGEKIVADGPTTGTVIGADGWIISSMYSFRQNPASILVSLPDGRRKPARVVARDYSRELALLKIEVDEDLTSIPIGDTAAGPLSQDSVGKRVVALGKTYDRKQVSQSTGIISAVGRAYGKAFQTDAKISPINYGGPIVDLDGQVLGIIAPLSPGEFLEGDSSNIYDSGIGFAVPLKDILERLPKLQKGEDIYAGKLGAVPSTQNEMAGPVRLVGAIPGSPAGKAGLKPGDIVLEANEKPIRLLADLKHSLASVDAGGELLLSVFRKQQRIDGIRCKLSKQVPTYRKRYLGLRVESGLETDSTQDSDDDTNAGEQNDRQTKAALKVTAILPESPASESELSVGDVLLSIDERSLQTPKDLREILAVAELDRTLTLQILSDGQPKQLEIRPGLWPASIPAQLPEPAVSLPENAQSKTVQIALGDSPNQAFAVIPPLAQQRPLGLLLVYPEPGDLDQEATREHWSPFASQQGWIIAVIQSADPQRWTPNEIELAERVLGRLRKSYQLDESRIVLSGMGIGGRLALLSATMLRDRVSGVLTWQTNLDRLRPPPPHFPMQSLDYLLVGKDEEALQTPKDLISQLGYSVATVTSPGLLPSKWETHPTAEIQRWLEGLARY